MMIYFIFWYYINQEKETIEKELNIQEAKKTSKSGSSKHLVKNKSTPKSNKVTGENSLKNTSVRKRTKPHQNFLKY